MKITDINQLDPAGSYTYADYLTWQFDEYVELLRGKIFRMSPAPSRRHQEISINLTTLFKQYLWKNSCKVYSAPFDVRLPHFNKKKNKEVITVVQPDICIVCDTEKLDVKGCIGAPDLIIEIVSPGNSRKELREKFEIYEESGVREYWIVNPQENSVQVFELNEAGKYIGLKPNIEDDIVSPCIFPELKIDLKEVFAE